MTQKRHLVAVDNISIECGLKDFGIELTGTIEVKHWDFKVNNGIHFHKVSLNQDRFSGEWGYSNTVLFPESSAYEGKDLCC